MTGFDLFGPFTLVFLHKFYYYYHCSYRKPTVTFSSIFSLAKVILTFNVTAVEKMRTEVSNAIFL